MSRGRRSIEKEFIRHLNSKGGHIGHVENYLFRTGARGIELRGSLSYIKPKLKEYHKTIFSKGRVIMYGYRIPIIGMEVDPITGREYFEAINGGFITCDHEIQEIPESRKISKFDVIKKFSS